MRPTFEEQDRIAAAREEKRRQCVSRLAQILSKEFDYQELVFIWTNDAVRVEAWELARLKARR